MAQLLSLIGHTHIAYGNLHNAHSMRRSEQVWEEGASKVGLVEDEAHKANHGNAAQGHLKLQGREKRWRECSSRVGDREVSVLGVGWQMRLAHRGVQCAQLTGVQLALVLCRRNSFKL
jgi:hypothetical protein